MKVLHLSTFDINGGAARAAYRLHTALCQKDINSVMLVANKDSIDETVISPFNKIEKLWNKIAPHLDKSLCRLSSASKSGLISPAWVPNFISHKLHNMNADIINLHWICEGFIKPETLKKFKKPIVWTLHDMWAFTGGEHYVGNCNRYIEGYSRKNRPKGESGFDLNRWVWKRKKDAISKLENLYIVSPSRWLAECARKSLILKDKPISVIPNALDHQCFKPYDKQIVRDYLRLPKNKKIILFGAMNATSDPRKGYHLLQPALLQLSKLNDYQDFELVVFGASKSKNKDEEFGFKTHYMGLFKDEISLALLYAAADVFIAPSTEDNLPNTVMESLACGTPVVAFNIGGMPDMIEHKQNGYLVKPFEIDDLIKGIIWILENEERWKHLSYCARKKVENEFTYDKQAKAYIELYEKILAETTLK